jgi:hypothetical protein
MLSNKKIKICCFATSRDVLERLISQYLDNTAYIELSPQSGTALSLV